MTVPLLSIPSVKLSAISWRNLLLYTPVRESLMDDSLNARVISFALKTGWASVIYSDAMLNLLDRSDDCDVSLSAII